MAPEMIQISKKETFPTERELPLKATSRRPTNVIVILAKQRLVARGGDTRGKGLSFVRSFFLSDVLLAVPESCSFPALINKVIHFSPLLVWDVHA